MPILLHSMYRLVLKQNALINTQRNYVGTIPAGKPYVMIDFHVRDSVPAEACHELKPYCHPRPYLGQPLHGKSFLLLWPAGLGDTIALTPALLSLQKQNPSATIDILTIPVLYEIMSAAGFKGRLIPYPCPVETIESYDYFLASEQHGKDSDCFLVDSIDFYAKMLHQPAGLFPVPFTIPENFLNEMKLPSGNHRRLGVQMKSLSPIRTYPSDLLTELLTMLVKKKYEVHLLGSEGDCDAPSAPPLFHNHCGQTKTFFQTAALVQQMNTVICPDSFIMHLAGVLKIPAIALFSTIPAKLRISRYPHILGLEPNAPCAPCYAILDDHCPKGHSECIALRTETMTPQAILKKLQAL